MAKKGENIPEKTKIKMRESAKKVWSDTELRKRQSESQKGKKNSMFGRKGKESPRYGISHTLESNKKNSESNKGKIPWNKGVPCREETKNKLSKANKGNPSPMKGKKIPYKSHPKMKGKIPWNKGKPCSKETKRKLEKALSGKKHSTKTLKKMSNSHKGKPSPMKGKKHSKKTIDKLKKARAKRIIPIKDTKIEIKIQNFLKELQIEFIPHKLMEIKHRYQCDIFIPSMNLVIECDGDYWHGNTDNPKFKILNKSQIKQKEKDSIRTKELLEKGFKVLRLWESEINELTTDNFKNKIEEMK